MVWPYIYRLNIYSLPSLIFSKSGDKMATTSMAKVFVLSICLTVILTSEASKKHKEKKPILQKPTTTEEPAKDEMDILVDDEKFAETNKKVAGQKEQEEADDSAVPDVVVDPCSGHHCGAGRECEADAEAKPQCVCVRTCPSEVDERRHVCSNFNDTWQSDCELYRMRCLCEDSDAQCTKAELAHAHVDYYGACREIGTCQPEEMQDFPRRMRDWLFNVMKEMADRNELDPDYLALEKEAEVMGNKWVNAVIWKFCDLDTHPHDRFVSRHELFPIRAPLLAMEHCIAPFLNGCDKNDDHKITLVEWGSCLGLEEEDIKDKCPK